MYLTYARAWYRKYHIFDDFVHIHLHFHSLDSESQHQCVVDPDPIKIVSVFKNFVDLDPHSENGSIHVKTG